MRWFPWVVVSVLLLVGVGCSSNQQVADLTRQVEELKAENEVLKSKGGSYTPGIDSLVKQGALKPAMIETVLPYVGVIASVSAGDWEGAQGAFQQFKQQTSKMNGMMGEWSEHVSPELVDSLGATLSERDKEAAEEGIKAIREACHGCHQTAMVEAQQRHHWPEFEAILSEDPINQDELSFAETMWRMELSLVSSLGLAMQGNAEGARQGFKEFETRFDAMSQTCSICHTTERMYYVDKESRTRLSAIAKLLESPNPAPDALMGAVTGMAETTCDPCHRVHLPAAYTQQRGL